MKVCLLTDKPDHPLLAALCDLLAGRVEAIDPDSGGDWIAVLTDSRLLADLYLLKAHSARAVALARQLEKLGGQVVNAAVATGLCQDRVRMAGQARTAGLPFPRTRSFTRLTELIAFSASPAAPRFPLVVKSRRSRRLDLVTRVDEPAQLQALDAAWAREPVVAQEFVAGDGWDYKLWVIGPRVFAGLRQGPLAAAASAVTHALDPEDLPPGWLDLSRRVGDVYGLRIYGLDILATDHGPVIVDVNPFPGCRDVPGAPHALAAFVREACFATAGRPARRSARSPDSAAPQAAWAAFAPAGRAPGKAPPVAALHAAVSELVAAPADLLRIRSGRHPALGVPRAVYLRRKPGRGMVASYRLVLDRPQRQRAAAPRPILTARLPEQSLADPQVGERLASLDPAQQECTGPGILCFPQPGLTVQVFPADPDLPGLPAALGAGPGGRLAPVLAVACRSVLGDPGIRVTSVQATPVRYKPGTRCVIRYRVGVAAPQGPPSTGRRLEPIFFGKLYREPADAVATYRLTERLWSMLAGSPALIPRPLALIADLNLVLSEAAGGHHAEDQRLGAAVLRPSRRPRPAAAGSDTEPPRQALMATAVALARLHTSGAGEGLVARPLGATYAARAAAWAHALAAAVPDLADALDRTTRPLTAALFKIVVERPVLVHGAFKPSQVVFCGPARPVITDLDGACLGDPALDVGCFLAYLRPPGLWRGQPGTRAWFTTAQRVFLDAYAGALRARGVRPAQLHGVRVHSSLFEATLLLKIASRRVRRLNSPRPGEVRFMLAEIDRSLQRFTCAGELRE